MKLKSNKEDRPRGKQLYLVIPTSATVNKFLAGYQYKNKDYFESALKPFINFVRDGNTVLWTGDPLAAKRCERLVNSIQTSQPAKTLLMEVFGLLYSNSINVIHLAEFLITGKVLELAKKIVNEGALKIEDVNDMMGWKRQEHRHGHYTYYDPLESNWNQSSQVGFLRSLCRTCRGSVKTPNNRYYPETSTYVIPGPTLIQYITSLTPKPAGIEELPGEVEYTIYDDQSLVTVAPIMQELILSRTVEPTKTKVGISTVKKMKSLVEITPFVDNDKYGVSAEELVTTLAFLALGFLSSSKLPDKPLENEKFLKEMFDKLRIGSGIDFYLPKLFISKFVKSVGQDFFYEYSNEFIGLFISVCTSLKFYDNSNQGLWCEYTGLANYITNGYGGLGFEYIYPALPYLKVTEVKYKDGNFMPMSVFKQFFYDQLMDCIILSMAALGAVDIAFDDDGSICYIRVTDTGRWYLGLTTVLPEIKGDVETGDIFDVDDTTGLILVLKPESPYVKMLNDFAEKVTDTRYRLSAKAFTTGCSTKNELEAKIERFRTFILKNPGDKIERLFSLLLSRCDVVRKTPGGTTYTLLDINPKESALHELLLGDRDIRKNTLRVEGCRLLVKTNYLPTLVSRLRKEGYINGNL